MKKLLLLSSFLCFTAVSSASAATSTNTTTPSSGAIDCMQVPDCSSLGYKDYASGCTNSVRCPFDTSKVLCLDNLASCEDFGYTDTASGCNNYFECPSDNSKVLCADNFNPIKALKNCKVGQYLGLQNGSNVCADIPIGDTKQLVIEKDDNFVYTANLTDPTTSYSYLPVGNYLGTSNELKPKLKNNILTANPTCHLWPKATIDDNIKDIASKFNNNDIYLTDTYSSYSIASNGSYSSKGTLSTKQPTIYLCADKHTEKASSSTSDPQYSSDTLTKFYRSNYINGTTKTIANLFTDVKNECTANNKSLANANNKFKIANTDSAARERLVIFNDIILLVKNEKIIGRYGTTATTQITNGNFGTNAYHIAAYYYCK